ncbi:MAG: hypothetical protein C5B51_14795 [Terriglobia bacterium]|nr:MAG: hypothetical protein C5B51_14795 [Terriglobia bacterium]
MSLKLQDRFIQHPEEFLGVGEAAGILRKTDGAVRSLVRERRLRGVKVGGTVWLWKPSLVRFVRPLDDSSASHGPSQTKEND